MLTYNNDNLLEIKLLQCGGYIAAEAAKRYIRARRGAATEAALKAEMEKAMGNSNDNFNIDGYDDDTKCEYFKTLALADPQKYLKVRSNARRTAFENVLKSHRERVLKGMSQDESKVILDKETKECEAYMDKMYPSYANWTNID